MRTSSVSIWLSVPLSACLPAEARRPAPRLALGEANALVLGAEIAVYDGPGAEARRVGALAAWTPVRVQAQGLACAPDGEDLCAARWMLEDGRWASGGGLAVRHDAPTVADDLGGSWFSGAPEPTDRSQVPSHVFFGVETRYELDEDRQPGRISATGWLAVEQGAGAQAVSLGFRSGWGSSTRISGLRWLDLDADGRAELVVSVDESVTEVGSVGTAVLVLGPDLKELLRIDVGDPRLNGLEQPAWGVARLVGATLVHESVTRVDCPPDLSAPAGASGVLACVQGTRHSWERLVARDEALPLRADGLPIVAWLDEEGPTVTGPVPYQVLVRDGAQTRWLRGATLEPAWLGAAFGQDREAARWVDLFAQP